MTVLLWYTVIPHAEISFSIAVLGAVIRLVCISVVGVTLYGGHCTRHQIALDGI